MEYRLANGAPKAQATTTKNEKKRKREREEKNNNIKEENEKGERKSEAEDNVDGCDVYCPPCMRDVGLCCELADFSPAPISERDKQTRKEQGRLRGSRVRVGEYECM